ncbi:hypothetical protein EJ05DRAFT_384673 [Pseudovirgaria hyperparasitica]|uniref:Uncharacterized protein n=1 Tax=Pseudovirgaria hyperparasitica TaxID=470096 RepID=A0A6A6W3Z0_9PEZI|nr:uncharacterized protein EJ05DRAFT_384673 [Pseudovirgaria hyperparasitica]KAF2757275.1 hypothetical protein EJ05DRAFT_384673 [Pseudovirgaria hyperparasitica]
MSLTQDNCITSNGDIEPDIDYTDIVATQGAYLIHRRCTPVFEKPYDREFATKLEIRLQALEIRLEWRRAMYRDSTDEWPIRHTPPEVKEYYRAKMIALEEQDDSSEDDSGDNVGEEVVNVKESYSLAKMPSYQEDSPYCEEEGKTPNQSFAMKESSQAGWRATPRSHGTPLAPSHVDDESKRQQEKTRKPELSTRKNDDTSINSYGSKALRTMGDVDPPYLNRQKRKRNFGEDDNEDGRVPPNKIAKHQTLP